MIASATGQLGWAFNLSLFLHVLCVVVGFGGVMLLGIWGSAQGKLTGAEAAAINRPMLLVTKVAEIFIYLVPVFGITTILLSDKQIKFKYPYISGAFAAYIVGIAISLLVLQPTVKKLAPLAEQLPAGAPERVALEKKVAASSGVLHLIFAVALFLMVFGPNMSWLNH